MAAKRATSRKAAPPEAAEADAKTGDRQREDAGTSPWEWAAAAIGCAILIAIVGYLVYEGTLRPPEARPLIVAISDPAIPMTEGLYLVPIRVENRGHVTGAGVGVSGALTAPDGTTIEESAVTFDFVAQHSKVEGGLYFTADPRGYRLVLRVEGYTDP